MEQYIKNATVQFETLLREQLARCEKMKEAAKPTDFANAEKIVIGIVDGDGIGPIIMNEAVKAAEKLLADEIAAGKIELRRVEGLTIENRLAKNQAVPTHSVYAAPVQAGASDTFQEILEMAQRVKEQTIAEAESKAAEIVANAEIEVKARLGNLTAEKSALEAQIADLKESAKSFKAQFVQMIGAAKAATLRDEVELLGAGRDFDMEAVRNGQLSPVFFGSALTTFGVEPFLEEFLRMTTAPLSRVSDQGEVDVFSEDFSAFVFKIQANMNKAHRDRLAFMRICSGKFQRDTEYYHMQSGKKMRLSQPQQMMAAEREIVEEAYAGDIIGVFDPGMFSIGDTITVPSKKFKYSGIPTFEPEHFMRVSPKDTMKRKQFIKGTEQIAQEGAIQIFKIPGAGLEEVIVGVVGTLQFDVFQHRMKNEYGVDMYMTSLPYDHLRLISNCPCKPEELVLCTGAAILEDFKERLLVAFDGEWSAGFLTKHNPGLEFAESLSV